MGSVPASAGNGNDAGKHFQSLQELLDAHNSMGKHLVAVSPAVHQTPLAGWTATEAAKGALFSGAFVEYAHLVKSAPRHQGAAADDAAYAKSKLGAGHAGAKAAATVLAKEDPGVKVKMRQLKHALRELKGVVGDFVKGGEVLAKVYDIELVGYDDTDGQPTYFSIDGHTKWSKHTTAGRAGLLIKTSLNQLVSKTFMNHEKVKAAAGALAVAFGATAQAQYSVEFASAMSAQVATAYQLYKLAEHALMPSAKSSLEVPRHQWTAGNSLASVHMSIAAHAALLAAAEAAGEGRETAGEGGEAAGDGGGEAAGEGGEATGEGGEAAAGEGGGEAAGGKATAEEGEATGEGGEAAGGEAAGGDDEAAPADTAVATPQAQS